MSGINPKITLKKKKKKASRRLTVVKINRSGTNTYTNSHTESDQESTGSKKLSNHRIRLCAVIFFFFFGAKMATLNVFLSMQQLQN